MDKQQKSDFEAILGVFAPWSISNIEIDTNKRIIDINVSKNKNGEKSSKSKFNFLAKNSSDSQSESMIRTRWRYPNINSFKCYISAEVPNQAVSDGIPRDSLTQPSFLGEVGKRYCNELRQQVSLSAARGFDRAMICSIYGLDEAIVESILSDIQKTPVNDRTATYLPTEINSVWREILLDKLLIRTQMLPLKFLLSKLKLASITPGNIEKLHASIDELRQFFIANSAMLEDECAQLCGLSLKKQAVAERKKAVNRLVLPALRSPIWVGMLSGRTNIKSNNMSLNLLLVRQRSSFQNSENNENKVRAISALREFFKKNARSLKQELIEINRLINQPTKKESATLPEHQHVVWQHILKDDSFIPSNHMAYKLLLAKLRSTLLMNPEPDIAMNAAKRVRDFYTHNQQSMQQESHLVIKRSLAV